MKTRTVATTETTGRLGITGRAPARPRTIPHSEHTESRSAHYHAHVIGQRASGAGGIARIQALNPDDTRPQASTINTETMGPG